jgi:hypothetical protein
MNTDEGGSADGGLSFGAVALIDNYFARFRVEAMTAGAQGWEDAVVDLRAHVRDRLQAGAGMPEDAVRVLAELGTTEALVAAYLDASPDDDSDGLLPDDVPPAGTGRLLGAPYDLRIAKSSGRYASRSWNPLDRRVVVPKAVGIGWTINFGALAVRTHLVSPDDEDIPFGAVPPRIVVATLAAPLAALATFVVLAALSWADLPAQVPMHWAISGHADGYGSRGTYLGFLSVLAVVPVAEAVWIHLRRRQPFTRVAASALSLSFTTLALALLCQALFTLDGGTWVWPTCVGLVFMLVLPFALLVVVSRIGRAAEQRRDLPGTSAKGNL